MQNVSNLVIPEGEVRTIHDEDNNLLWGRLNYDTKYAGDTLQNGTPTPDTPIPVQTVTGEQTITVSDGVDSENFTISLGSIELCKIGNYQDYIYKSGEDWYVHKKCGKAVFDGTESWSGGASTGSPTYLYAYTAALDSLSLYSARQAFCSHFTMASNMLATGTSVSYPCMSVVTPSAGTYAHIRLMIPLATAANINGLKTWLSSHNTNLYYVLATETDTKITDATLIGQLNNVHEWLTRYGYNATVTGNLPLIVNRTNL